MLGLLVLFGQAMAQDAAGKKPAAWYPRTEKVGPDEMFIVALGTGMPTPITRAQKSTAWYVELGNGDIFLFDVGSGSAENLFAMRPEFHRVDKIFASHLHTDHVGDAAALWVGGWLSGRYTPLHIYGPSGSAPELGTAAFVEGLKMTYAWDISGRSGILPDAGGELVAHEFDYKPAATRRGLPHDSPARTGPDDARGGPHGLRRAAGDRQRPDGLDRDERQYRAA